MSSLFDIHRAALSPTQLEILLKYFHFGQSSVISALVRDEEKNEGDVKDASQLEQSILPEDEAIIKEMIGELEKQVIGSVPLNLEV